MARMEACLARLCASESSSRQPRYAPGCRVESEASARRRRAAPCPCGAPSATVAPSATPHQSNRGLELLVISCCDRSTHIRLVTSANTASATQVLTLFARHAQTSRVTGITLAPRHLTPSCSLIVAAAERFPTESTGGRRIVSHAPAADVRERVHCLRSRNAIEATGKTERCVCPANQCGSSCNLHVYRYL